MKSLLRAAALTSVVAALAACSGGLSDQDRALLISASKNAEAARDAAAQALQASQGAQAASASASADAKAASAKADSMSRGSSGK